MDWGDEIALLICLRYSQKHEKENYAKIQFHHLCFLFFPYSAHKRQQELFNAEVRDM